MTGTQTAPHTAMALSRITRMRRALPAPKAWARGGSVVLIRECPLNARLETGEGLSFLTFLGKGRAWQRWLAGLQNCAAVKRTEACEGEQRALKTQRRGERECWV
jgi:hypothetical protein